MDDDCWDKVINYEQEEYNKGVLEGREDGKLSGFYEDGIKAGFMKGYAYGIELGFYESVLNNYIHEEIESKSERMIQMNTDSSSNIEPTPSNESNSITLASSTSTSKESRIEKRILNILQKIENFKLNNDESIDYDFELNSIRSLYKSLNLQIGPFLLQNDNNNSNNNNNQINTSSSSQIVTKSSNTLVNAASLSW